MKPTTHYQMADIPWDSELEHVSDVEDDCQQPSIAVEAPIELSTSKSVLCSRLLVNKLDKINLILACQFESLGLPRIIVE